MAHGVGMSSIAPSPPLSRADVLTAREVAALLQLPVSTVYYLARWGDLPARRFGRTWRFFRPSLERFLRAEASR